MRYDFVDNHHIFVEKISDDRFTFATAANQPGVFCAQLSDWDFKTPEAALTFGKMYVRGLSVEPRCPWSFA